MFSKQNNSLEYKKAKINEWQICKFPKKKKLYIIKENVGVYLPLTNVY